MIAQLGTLLDTSKDRLVKKIQDYWNSPKGAFKIEIEYSIGIFEGIPENERKRQNQVTLPNGTNVQYGEAVDNLIIQLLRIEGRGYDLSRYKERVKRLRSY